MMSETSIHEMMLSIPVYFNAEKAVGISANVQCIFTGEDASNWVITIEDQTCQVEQGIAPEPDLTLKANAKDGVNLLTGKTDAMRAFILGKVKVSGNMALGMKLINLFKP
jgi:putative sterol carrier protein